MSIPEASIRPPSPPDANPRPSIPPKPSPKSVSPLKEEGGGSDRSPGSQVKRIVDRFSHKQPEPPPAGAQTSRTTSKPVSSKVFKRAPTVKPKPVRQRLQNQKEGDRAPPLPTKRRFVPLKQSEFQTETPGGVEGNDVNIEGGRSAPDGKEVELNVIGGEDTKAEHGSDAGPSSHCEPHCSCVCHLQRPGMKLIWVPEVGEEVGEGEEKEEEEFGEEEVGWEEATGEEDIYELEVEARGGVEVNAAGEGCEAKEAGGAEASQKKTFHRVLDAIIGESSRRRSDPGPPAAVLAATAAPRSSPPAPPRRTCAPLCRTGSLRHQQRQEEEEEENIYEETLFVPPQKPACTELDIPLIRVRRSKASSGTSEPSSQFHAEPQGPPPALPPRVPLPLDKGGAVSAPPPRGGIPLPQPTAEERRSLPVQSLGNDNNNSSSNKAAAAGSGPDAPERASSPLLPCRAAPLPPCPTPDSRRLSRVSMETKEPEENGRSDGEREGAEEERPPVAPPRRASPFSSRLQDEPLYQTYRASVITKEIRRQTVYRSVSKASADYSMDWSGLRVGTGNGVPRKGTGISSSHSTLWQELPAVRDSGVLQKLTPEECKYQESMFEVLTSEASYLRSLCVLTEHFHDSRDLEDTLIIRDRKTLFSNILRVREVSERFLKDLEDRMDESLVLSDICDIIHYHAQHNFHAYIDYVRNQIYQEKTYTSLMKNNLQFAAVITRLQESPQCHRLPFMSFLLLPFQRITRIKMLIENILKRTKEGTKEEQTASKALDSVSKIIAECNTEVGKMKQVEELIHLSKMLEFDKLKAIPIISHTRYLEKKGELQEMSKGGTLFNTRAKFIPIFLFLFNDLLIIAAKKGAERFLVLDHAHRSLVQVQPVEDGAGTITYEHCFNLTLLENHQGKMMERLIKAPSQSDVDRWMAAFPNPNNPDGNEDEVIYEDWDCPQVQCVEQYTAQQADELNLEPAEIINIVRKANEGWYEGTRLSDGQRGWFPAANVLEITNEHVRRRNLRERYRVMQAASAMAASKGLLTT